MTGWMQRYCAIALALVVALGGLTQAHGGGAHSMVICTGDGLKRITLAPDGTPVEQSLPCPDCVQGAATLIPDAAALSAQSLPGRAEELCLRTVWAGASAGYWAEGRSPPVFV